ncbi:MAG: cation:proton antiporter [Lepagella sp.]
MIDQPVAIFFIVLLIILLGPLLFRPLKVPPVVGMIIAGMIVGPYGFGFLDRDDSFRIFGEVGILYIMFQAAVEIDMYHLKRNYRQGLVFGLLSFLLPMVGGIFTSHYLFHLPWDTSMLIASMYASHTLVAYPAVSRFGLQNTRGAVIAVCGTIVAVMLALICLAGVVQTHVTGSFGIADILRLLLFMAIYCVAIAYALPFAARRFFRSVSDPVAQYIFILALVFVASLLAKAIGLESILGAFYAGLVLNRLIPGRSPLMRNLRFVGDSIFIPYFLIGVGMLINIRAVFSGWYVLWVVINMSAIALITKWIAAHATRLIYRLPADEGRLMFGLSAGKAAATIAAVMIGFKYDMLSEDVTNGAVVMILICCMVASVTTERAARNIRMRLKALDLEQEKIGEAGFARQVVSISNPLTAEGLMRLAISMRSRVNRNPISLLHVRSSNDTRSRAMSAAAMQGAEAVAEDLGVEVQRLERFDTNVAAALRNVAVERDATEIVIGLHRKASIVDTFFGSTIDQLIESTRRMVVMSRCFVPIDTLTGIVVVVPKKAEYESGFHLWVSRILMLASNIEAKVTFISYRETGEFIRTAMAEDGVEVEVKFEVLDSYDDFILLSGNVGDDDLFVVIGARKGSISHSSDLDNLPGFLSRYFSRHNLAMIYPQQ